MRLLETLVVRPNAEPVTVDEVKADARVDGNAIDESIQGYIGAARALAEQETGRRLCTQTVRYELTDWPTTDDAITLSPLQSVSVTYWNGSAWTAFTDVTLVDTDLGPVVEASTGFTFPTLPEKKGARVRIDAVVGYGGTNDVPMGIKQFVKAHAVQVVDNPSMVTDGRMVPLDFLKYLLDPFRTWR